MDSDRGDDFLTTQGKESSRLNAKQHMCAIALVKIAGKITVRRGSGFRWL